MLALVSAGAMLVATSAEPLLSNDDTHHWIARIGDGNFTATIVSLSGVGHGWLAILPFYGFAAIAAAAAIAATRLPLVRRDVAVAVAALVAWIVGRARRAGAARGRPARPPELRRRSPRSGSSQRPSGESRGWPAETCSELRPALLLLVFALRRFDEHTKWALLVALARPRRARAREAARGPGAAPRHSCLNRSVAALYRKYRPQTFEEVVGQEAVVRTLRNAITGDTVRQAYLFAGPRGTGKTSMARILAKCLNCAHGPTTTPDGTCHVCSTIAAGTSLDVIEMDAASQRGIDDIREIRDRVVLQPVEGRYKVYILDEAHQLTDAAWNALLKLIEEPPPHLVFVFCTTDLSKVLPTVRSRCQTFVFQRPRLQDLVKVLRMIADAEGIDAPDQALALVARGARGAYRDAESTLDQLAVLDRRNGHGAGGARSCSARSRRRRSSALRPRRRPRHRRRADVRRGALRAGTRSRPARHRICSSTCAI